MLLNTCAPLKRWQLIWRLALKQQMGVFRLNIGISKQTYWSLFGPQPARPAAGGVVETGHDFTVLDQLLPHPVYGWMSWVSVLNPSATTFETVKPLLAEAYDLAVGKFAKRAAGR